MDKQKLIALVQRAQRGDAEALSELFAAYRNEVYSIAMQHTKNRALSEDIVQEAFLEVILKIDTLNQPASFPSWLKVLAYHQCTRYYKKKENVHEVSAAENEEGFSVLDTLEETNAAFLPDAALDQAEFRATILEMLDTLPDAQRAALQMFYYEQMPLKVIAKVQGVSVNTANTRLNRGRLAVKNSVEEYEKKHGVRLHTIAFFPFFRWLLRGTKQAMPEDAAARVAQGIALKSGVNLSVKTGLTGSAAAPAVPTASAAAKTAAAGLKVIPTGLATKIVAGVAAVSIVAGGVAVVQSGVERKEKPETGVVMQETREAIGTEVIEEKPHEEGNILESSDALQDHSSEQFLDISNAWTIREEMNNAILGITYLFDGDGRFYYLMGQLYSEYFAFYCGEYHVMDDILVLSMSVDGARRTSAYRMGTGNQWTQITPNGAFSTHKPGKVLELKVDEWKTKEELKEIALVNLEDSSFFDAGQYRSCPYFNKETGQTGLVGVDISQGENSILLYFGCWVDGVSASAEDFIIEYQEGVRQYTVTGNRNKLAQYQLTVDWQDAYIDVAVKRLDDEYKVIPEGDYRFYLAD